MLRSVRLQNLRSFVDTGSIELRHLNVFIGANNAGKTSFLSAIELVLQSAREGGASGPLAFEAIPNFASFDSVLRRHWSPTEQRPTEFTISFERDGYRGTRAFHEFKCRGRPKDNTTYVAEATYKHGESEFTLASQSPSPRRPQYQIRSGRKVFNESRIFFHQLIPIGPHLRIPGVEKFLRSADRFLNVEVVHPYRPVPRSFYVLDDPSLSLADRELLSFLLRVWASEETHVIAIRNRIVDNLRGLRLVNAFEVQQVSKRYGPKVIEIRVAPTIRRHRVTIADAGFGLSQVLPLAAYDARLSKGYFLAYQPEVHLHPFAQSRLADLFARSVARGNQVFVETHSPDLVLRLQQQVAKGDLPAKAVRVFCVENRGGKSNLKSVDFTSAGSPAIPWPAGFLDTSLTLARELASQRIARKK